MTDSLPTFSQAPPAPRAQRHNVTYPWVLGQAQGPGDIIYVTFALPELGRATVAVPYSTWIDGGHLPIGRELFDVFESWDPAI